LTDEQKVIAEYWADGPQTILPPGHWHLIAEYVSTRDKLSLDDNVKLFFSLGNAVSDAGIAAWDAKEHYDYIRPISAIQYLAANHLLPNDHPLVRTNPQTNVQEIYTWAGPDQGSQWIDGTTWLPYQKSTFVTPPFAEYVSGHSTFSAAGAEILKRFTNSDELGACHTQLSNTSTFETHTPSNSIKLCWDTFTSAADEAGISRLYGGIHFQDGDINGRVLGRKVGAAVWEKAQYYINGGKSAKSIPESSSVLSLLTFVAFSAVSFIKSNPISRMRK
ncbi:MAG: vanadium-dependent haloperoxidase, partial [Richelia sp. RM1_1_1]|nr:vanadium-dependent haloperoxidase [Richelia sp. RM1_1_1]